MSSLSESYNINDLFQEAQTRWLKPPEVLFILQNYEKYQLTHEPPQTPPTGSLFLFNKRTLRNFRKDGHNWRKKKDNRSIKEAHERLKVGSDEALNCYYAHGEDNPNFQRRSYWMLDPAFKDIVLAHYRDVTEGKSSPGSMSLSPQSATQQSPVSSSNSLFGEARSEFVIEGNGKYDMEIEASKSQQVNQYLRKIEEQLSLNEDSIGQINSSYVREDGLDDSDMLTDYLGTQRLPADFCEPHKDSWNLNEFLDSYGTSTVYNEQQENFPYHDNELVSEGNHLSDFNHPHDAKCSDIPSQESELFSVLYNHGNAGIPIELGSDSAISSPAKFTIRDLTPNWGFTSEPTKIIVVGSFLCDPSPYEVKCKVGEYEVPVEIIQEGVLRCDVPPHQSGKVSISVTFNGECGSETREFEYKEKLPQGETLKSPEELLLLVRWVHMLLCDTTAEKEDEEHHHMLKLTTDDETWNQVMESVVFGSGPPSSTMEWITEQLLKHQLKRWISSKLKGSSRQDGCCLSKKDQGIIHSIAGLGFDWALSPVLRCFVSVDFRDIRGWTALHWAARFGREKMVAALLASGASALAVTDPDPSNPVGHTPASIAEFYGHKGLAGYLSEVALTTHLSSLALARDENSEIAEVGAAATADAFLNDDQLYLKDTLAAVRNAAQAAARIQAAFRSYSFRKRKQEEANNTDIEGLSALSRMTFGNGRDRNSAALSIQKKYRGWKGRKDFLSIKRKVVKLQAHVRGYQARKNYRVCWAVGILEKAILRWRRKGAGLRGFRNDSDLLEETDDEDILKLFRLQKVNKAVDEAVSRVLSLVESSEARQQYHRMLLRFWQAKAELGGASSDTAMASPVAFERS